MKILLESILEGISSKVDNTVSLKFGTQELDSSKAGELFSLRGKFVKLLISDTNITNLESELIDSTPLVNVKKNKTESQRLRAVLFRVHEQGNGEVDFETFYKSEINRIIDHYKTKLD